VPDNGRFCSSYTLLFLAGGEVVGRVVSSTDQRHSPAYKKRTKAYTSYTLLDLQDHSARVSDHSS
jgi:hypothetical protein